MESYVLRPMIRAFVRGLLEMDEDVEGRRAVMRAKKDMSAFMRGHGSVPFAPIPSRNPWPGDGRETGVVATTRVRGRGGVVGIVGRWRLGVGLRVFKSQCLVDN